MPQYQGGEGGESLEPRGLSEIEQQPSPAQLRKQQGILVLASQTQTQAQDCMESVGVHRERYQRYRTSEKDDRICDKSNDTDWGCSTPASLYNDGIFMTTFSVSVSACGLPDDGGDLLVV